MEQITDSFMYIRIPGVQLAPQFVYNPNYFKVIKSDGWSTPSFADFTGNGVLDMMSGENYGLYYARNDGSIYFPALVQAASGFTTLEPGFRSSPQFIDWDKDGDYDIVTGYSSGKLTLYVNNNGTFSAHATMFSNIQVSYASMPAMADIDDDGDIDILVGSDDSNSSKFYLNQGDNTFIENTTVFTGVTFPRGTSPAFCDVDNDGDYDLFIGKTFGGAIDYYNNTGTTKAPVWTLDNQLLSGIRTKQNAHPSFADLDSDGYMDMILGEYDGNFTWYRNPASEFLSTEELSQVPLVFNLMQNYPNPFNPSTTIRFVIREASHVSLKLYDLSGKEVAVLVDEFKNSGEYSANFTAKGLSSGVYFYRLENGSNVITRKMLLLK
jgi:hypothetical protein